MNKFAEIARVLEDEEIECAFFHNSCLCLKLKDKGTMIVFNSIDPDFIDILECL